MKARKNHRMKHNVPKPSALLRILSSSSPMSSPQYSAVPLLRLLFIPLPHLHLAKRLIDRAPRLFTFVLRQLYCRFVLVAHRMHPTTLRLWEAHISHDETRRETRSDAFLQVKLMWFNYQTSLFNNPLIKGINL